LIYWDHVIKWVHHVYVTYFKLTQYNTQGETYYIESKKKIYIAIKISKIEARCSLYCTICIAFYKQTYTLYWYMAIFFVL
jgi:hypothetical protein